MGILNKKAQVQIQETILAIFIIIVLIVFGLVFFYRVQSASIVQDFNKFQREKLIIDSVTLSELPELSCSKAGIKENCMDTVKILAFANLNKGKYSEYYEERLGYKNITIYQIYPMENNKECSIGLIECGTLSVYLNKPERIQSRIILDTPVSLYKPCKDSACSDDTYAIGILIIEAYNE